MLSQKESQIFPPTTGGAEKMCQNLNVSLLGKVPLDPQIGNVTVLHYNFKTVLVLLLGRLTCRILNVLRLR